MGEWTAEGDKDRVYLPMVDNLGHFTQAAQELRDLSEHHHASATGSNWLQWSDSDVSEWNRRVGALVDTYRRNTHPQAIT
jgi:hypothetical protein